MCPTGFMSDSNYICNVCTDCSKKFTLAITDANEIANGIVLVLSSNQTLNATYLASPNVINVSIVLAGASFGIPINVTKLSAVGSTVTVTAKYPNPLQIAGSVINVLFKIIPWTDTSPLSTVYFESPFNGLEFKKNDNFCYASNFLSSVFLIVFAFTIPWNNPS